MIRLGEKLINATTTGQLRLNYDGHLIIAEQNNTVMIRDVICPRDTMLSNNGRDCGRNKVSTLAHKASFNVRLKFKLFS